MNAATKNKFIIAILLALFMVPMLIASSMYFTGKGIPQQTVNHGTLITPPLNFAELPLSKIAQHTQLKGKWLLVYINPKDCSQQCFDTLYKIRQTHTALGKDSDRLARVYISLQPLSSVIQQQMSKAYTGTQTLVTTKVALSKLLAGMPYKEETFIHGRLYVVDPLGNMMMTYPLDIAFKPLLSDLKRLLQLSQIG